ncbi:type IV pilus modification PilV family protein [Anaerotalea alkaliphila]|uniref:Type II secretion system protein n=1 Tax=Anaerotalea alkaliphila TaxID=2662126 RepID=A0A7X5HT37_9FIRM|nr:type II secretion system protein [Anaerotalea alkaliphila]NDL66172.1 type II secretion system protein [Anaerotalea alkaliphila]
MDPSDRISGFTLVEVVVSIAVLSLLSVFFLQLFLKAQEVNGRARELDQATVLASGLLESAKAAGRMAPEDLPHPYGSMLPMDGNPQGARFHLLLDGDFRPLADGSPWTYRLVFEESLEESRKDPAVPGRFKGLYRWTCKVEKETGTTLVRLVAGHRRQVETLPGEVDG